MASRTLTIEILGDRSSLSRAFKGVGGDVSKFEGHVKRAGHTLSTFGKIAGGAGLALGAGVAVEAKRAVVAFEETRKVAAQTNAVLKSTGGAAKISAAGVADLASAISKKTGIDDEAIQSSENMLLTFTKIRDETGKGNDIFTQATKVVTDMSVALGQDGTKSSIQLGKALNDPIKGVTALQRVGVTFTAEQKKQIGTLEATGHHLKAQKIILRELNTEFKGSAAAQATPLQKAKVAAGNLEEALGRGLAPVVDTVLTKFTNLARKVEPQLSKLTKQISGTFNRGDIDLSEKFTISWAKVKRKLAPLAAQFKGSLQGAHLDRKLSDVVEAAAPRIADAFAAAAPRAAGAFVRAFKEAGPWGKLVTVAFLASKMGAFSGVGSWAAGKFTGALKRRMATTMPAAGAAGGAAYSGSFATASSTGIAAAGGKGGKMRNAATRAGRGLGGAMGIAAAGLFAVELARGVESALKGELPGGDTSKPGRPTGTPGAGWNLFDFIKSKVGNAAGDVVGSLDFGAMLGGGSLGGFQTAGLQKEAKQGLSYIQSHFGNVRVSSGWRSRKENAAVGGAPNSDHLSGLALDLVPSEGWTGAGTARLDRIAAWARKSPAIRWIGWRGVPGHGPGDHLHLSFMDRVAGDVAMVGGKLKAFGGKVRGKGDVAPIQRATQAAYGAGFRGQDLVNMVAIAGRESGYNPASTNLVPPDHSIGLWQINQLAHHGRFGSDAALKNPSTNARAAYALFKSSGLTPWAHAGGPLGGTNIGRARAAVAAFNRRGHRAGGRSGGGGGGGLDNAIANVIGGTPPIGGGVPARSGGSVGTDYGAGGYAAGLSNVGLEKATASAHDSLPAMIRALQHEKNLKRRRIAKIRRYLKRARVQKKYRIQFTDELAQLISDLTEINALLKEYKADAKGGATTISGAEALTAGVADSSGAPEAEAGPTSTDFANAAIAEASLTPGLDDDIAATRGLLDIATGDLNAARASGDPRRISEAIGVWSSVNQSLQDLLGVVNNEAETRQRLLDATLENTAELKKNNEFSTSVAGIATREAIRALADVISGQIVGTNLQGRRLTAGNGVVAITP